jgi:hypothetical protein
MKYKEEGGEIQEKWDCLFDEFEIEQTDLDCAVLRATPLGGSFVKS